MGYQRLKFMSIYTIQDTLVVAPDTVGWHDDLRFYVLLNSIQSYQDDACVIIKDCMQ